MCTLEDSVRQIGARVHERDDKSTNYTVAKSDFDKTYIGRVVGKLTNEKDTEIAQWLVLANGMTYKVAVNDSNITAVGQQVRLYIPSNHYENKYAEVISPSTCPDKIVYKDTDEKIDGMAVSTITETWELCNDTQLEREYKLVIKDIGDEEKEEVIAIICPNSHIINLEGFMIWGTSSQGGDNSGQNGT